MRRLGRRETVVAGPEARGERLDLFLARSLPGASRKSVKRALDAGRVFLEGKVIRRAGHLLAGSETVSLTLEDAPPPPPSPTPVVLYRDHCMLALDKPPALPAHPTVAGRANALDLVRDLPGVENPILLHRLDADTSGLLLFALNEEANRHLARQFAERQVEKVYLALVAGAPPENFCVQNFLRPGVRGRTVATSSGGQAARTEFRTLARGPGFGLVEARPHTGRTHQIRVHLAGEGFPLLGDSLYGGAPALRIEGDVLRAQRHLLHARVLRVRHPQTEEEIALSAPLPEDFYPFVNRVISAGEMQFERKGHGP